MSYMWLIIISFVIAAADQLSKFLVSLNMVEGQSVTVIRGVFELYYVKNTGMAWSLLSGSRWIFVGLTLVFFALIGILVYKKVFTKKFELICLAAIVGGGLGNLIDRIAFGEVTDMLRVRLFDYIVPGNFPVFNVADCFVTCGCAALIVYLIFFDRKKPQKAIEESHADQE